MTDNTFINQTEFQEESPNPELAKKKKKKSKQNQTYDSSKRSIGVSEGAAAFGIGKLIVDAVRSDGKEIKVTIFRPAIDSNEEIQLETEPGDTIEKNNDIVAVAVEEDEPESVFEVETIEKGASLNELPFAQSVDDSMSYKTAFAAARKELGSGGLFVWHGKPYGTFYGSELKEMSAEDREQYVENVRYSIEQLEHQQEQEAEFEAREELPLVDQLEPIPTHRIDSINAQEIVPSEVEVTIEDDINTPEEVVDVEMVQDEGVIPESGSIVEETPINVEVEVEEEDSSTDESFGDDDGSHPDYDLSASMEIDDSLPIDNGMNMDEFFDNDMFDSMP